MRGEIDRSLVLDMAKEMRKVSDALWNLSVDMEDFVAVMPNRADCFDARLNDIIRDLTGQPRIIDFGEA